MNEYQKYWFFMLLILLSFSLLEASCTSNPPALDNQPPVSVPVPRDNTGFISDKPATSSSGEITFPIDQALSRVTKKTFGLHVSPGHSPIFPERFTGYHTGVDFETFPSEQNEDIVIRSICTGPLMLKKWGTGYGGVAVQQCQLKKQTVTLIYGHLKFESIRTPIQAIIQSGEQIGILGKGFSHETDGERKHLHLAIHRGSEIDIRGYVATPTELSGWIDPLQYFER
ncbi:MAG: peptidoglycan DD-metalloendopeptidase family protein [Candidatus Gracilibacteria bacterium]|nr:peptidoglycan DD-metalloendopeptidase family protein [Candidatus Gracilibacteria bacterium]